MVRRELPVPVPLVVVYKTIIELHKVHVVKTKKNLANFLSVMKTLNFPLVYSYFLCLKTIMAPQR
jgi:hypothetical protein